VDLVGLAANAIGFAPTDLGKILAIVRAIGIWESARPQMIAIHVTRQSGGRLVRRRRHRGQGKSRRPNAVSGYEKVRAVDVSEGTQRNWPAGERIVQFAEETLVHSGVAIFSSEHRHKQDGIRPGERMARPSARR